MSFGTIMHVVKDAGHLMCGDVVGTVEEGAFEVVSAVGGDVVKEVLGNTVCQKLQRPVSSKCYSRGGQFSSDLYLKNNYTLWLGVI